MYNHYVSAVVKEAFGFGGEFGDVCGLDFYYVAVLCHDVANPLADGNLGLAVVFERVQVLERAV